MRYVLCVLVLALACNENDLHRVDHEEVFIQEGTDQVDILWVVDNSNSMADEQVLVAQGFLRFIDALSYNSDVDFHIGVVNTDMDEENAERGLLIGEPTFLDRNDNYFDEFMLRVRVGTDGSDKERGLQAAYHALTDVDALEYNDGFQREEAVLALIFVSDENDCSDDNFIPDNEPGYLCYDLNDKMISTRDYIKRFQGIKGKEGRVVASSIVGPDADQGCENSWPGKRYMTVSDGLDGLIGNICEPDFGQIMEDVGDRIAGPSRIFYLEYLPYENSIVVKINDEEIPEDNNAGWYFDAEFNAVRFDGSYIPEFGSEIHIYYDIAGSL